MQVYDFGGVKPKAIRVVANETFGVRNLIFQSDTQGQQSVFLHEEFWMQSQDYLQSITVEEGKEVVGFFAKLRNIEVEVDEAEGQED